MLKELSGEPIDLVMDDTFKRVATYIPKFLGNKTLKRILFMKYFLNWLEQSNERIILVLDEAGFGTRPLRHYAYSLKN